MAVVVVMDNRLILVVTPPPTPAVFVAVVSVAVAADREKRSEVEWDRWKGVVESMAEATVNVGPFISWPVVVRTVCCGLRCGWRVRAAACRWLAHAGGTVGGCRSAARLDAQGKLSSRAASD